MATQVVSRVRQEMKVELSLAAVFAETTLADLAAEVDRLALAAGLLKEGAASADLEDIEI